MDNDVEQWLLLMGVTWQCGSAARHGKPRQWVTECDALACCVASTCTCTRASTNRELSRRPSRNPCHMHGTRLAAWAGLAWDVDESLNLDLRAPVALTCAIDGKVLPMSNIIMAGLKRSKVRVPCTQSQFMRFVLAAGLLTRSYPIPNPNPQTLVMCSVLSTGRVRGEGGC